MLCNPLWSPDCRLCIESYMFPDRCHASLSPPLHPRLFVPTSPGGFLSPISLARGFQTAAAARAGVETERIVRMNAAVIQHRARQTDLGYMFLASRCYGSRPHDKWHSPAATLQKHADLEGADGRLLLTWRPIGALLFNCPPGCLFPPAAAASLGSSSPPFCRSFFLSFFFFFHLKPKQLPGPCWDTDRAVDVVIVECIDKKRRQTILLLFLAL